MIFTPHAAPDIILLNNFRKFSRITFFLKDFTLVSLGLFEREVKVIESTNLDWSTVT